MFINRLLDGSGGVMPHTLTLCKDILTRHYEICDGVYGMMLDTLVGSKYCKKSVKLSDTIRISFCWVSVLWFPGGSVVKNPSASAVDTGDTGSILGLGKAPGEERATCSYILGWEIPWTGAWWTVAHGVKKSQTRLSDWASKLWQSEKAEPGRLEDSPVPEEEGLFNREVPECPPLSEPWGRALQGFCVDEAEAASSSFRAVWWTASEPRDVEGLQEKVYYNQFWKHFRAPQAGHIISKWVFTYSNISEKYPNGSRYVFLFYENSFWFFLLGNNLAPPETPVFLSRYAEGQWRHRSLAVKTLNLTN